MKHEEISEIEAKGFIVADYSKELIEKIEEESDQIMACLDASNIYVLIEALLGLSRPYVIVQDNDQLKIIYPSFIKVK